MTKANSAPFALPKTAASNFAAEKTRKHRKPADHLEYDTRRAQELGYGCHYGKYKADHPKTQAEYEELYSKPKPKVAPNRRTLNCPVCGKTFYMPPKVANKMYCSEECRNRALQDKKLKKLPPFRCVWCDEEIPRGSRRTKYCCEDCYNAAQKHMDAERRKQRNGSI